MWDHTTLTGRRLRDGFLTFCGDGLLRDAVAGVSAFFRPLAIMLLRYRLFGLIHLGFDTAAIFYG
ncbi:hypothetical protein CAP37_19120 [Hydrogenophaga sp. IBVHS1]|nr:hypothetical protein CAP37_19120 [Hydrogenophaga sp. IBVHS1]